MTTTRHPSAGQAAEHVPSLLELDRGPWRYGFDSPATTSGHSHFVESDDFPDVRLYINGNFGSDEERATYGRAVALALNNVHAAVAHIDVARVAQRQLDALKSLAMMASSFANELSKDHPDVVEAFAALETAKDLPAAPLALETIVLALAAIVPFEDRVAGLTNGTAAEARERAMQEEIAEWRARAAAQAKANTMTRGADGNYNTGHADLDLLLGLTDDMVQGNANMDTGLLWMSVLERIQTSLGVAVDNAGETSAPAGTTPPQ